MNHGWLFKLNPLGLAIADPYNVTKARVFLEKKTNSRLPKDRDVKMEADSFLRNIIVNGI